MTTKNQKLRVVNLLLILFLIPGLLGLSSVQTVLAAGRLAAPAAKNDIPPVADIANFSILAVTVLEPLGYWKFDETSWAGDCSTADIMDSSGNNHHGIACINGDAPFPVPGKFGNAGRFDGINQYANMGPGFNFTSSFTAAMWIALDDYDWCGPTGKSQHIIGTHHLATSTGNGRGWGIYWDCNGLAWELTNSTGSKIESYGYVQPSPFPANGSWHHIALVYDSTVPSATLYWDGVPVYSESGTENVPSFLFNNGEPLTVNGLPYAPSAGAPGKIDDTRVYNSALSAVEIQTLFDNHPPEAVEDAYSTDQDTILNVTAPGVLGNDSDPNGNPITAVKVSDPANGTLSLDANGSFTYTPNAGFSGSDTFTYKASDGSLESNIASVSIQVNAIPAPSEPVIHYVKWNAVGTKDGTSWTDAFTYLQSALAAASSGDEIWVAAGTYKPTMGTDRNISFTLKNGVAIYGGFAGTETMLSQRNYETNVTTLSGDIGVVDDNSDNSYHVVVGSNTNNSAVLDGFIITGGNANQSQLDTGGGMLNYRGSPTVSNMIFRANSAGLGGGMYNGGDPGIAPNGSHPVLMNVVFEDNSAIEGGGMENQFYSSPTLTNVTFSNNTAVRSGGGMLNYDYSSPTLMNVTFSGNTATGGGGMSNFQSRPMLTNNTFHNNSATELGGALFNLSSLPSLVNTTISGNMAVQGGGIYNETANNHSITNSILYGNVGGEIYNYSGTPVVTYSIVQGGYPGTGNLDADPLLGPLQDNGGFSQTMALGAGSPAIDAGDDGTCPATDQRGVTRPHGSHCDIGAYEAEVTFSDVPFDYWSWEFIERLYNAGVTSGCSTSPSLFCPATTVTRDQMAVFLLRGKHGASYTPPPATGVFQDVPVDYWSAAWIEQLAAEGITSGCSVTPKLYCPITPVTRDQMAVFLLRAKHGSAYTPPPASGVFQDVPLNHWAAAWIEQLAAEGITSGCNVTPKLYCPNTPVTRDQMAVFLVKNFNLP